MKSSKTNHIGLLTVNQLLTNSTGSTGLGSGSTGSTGSGSTGSGSTGSGSTNRLTTNLFSVMLLAVLATGLFINGCAKQTLGEGNDMKDRNNDGSYNVGYSFDGVISSKSDFIDSESEIKDAYLVFYKNDPDPSEQKYVAYQEVNINSNSTSFALPIPDELDPGEEYKVLILGNYNSNEAGGKSFVVFIQDLLLTNRTFTEHRRLFYSETVGRLSEDLPFAGILQKIGDITEAERLFTCPDKNTGDLGVKVKFTRSVSRFDIINNVADKLVITKVKVCNYRDGGYFYHSDGFKGSVVSGIDDADGEIGVDAPIGNKQIVEGGLYGYPNLVLSTAQGDKFTTCLIIEGYYQNTGVPSNKLSYYRANISRDGDPQLLYPNRIYTITINDVKEEGSVDGKGAYLDINNELDYKTDSDWEAGDDNSSVDEDGNYIIVSRTDIVFDSREDLYDTITVQTKNNANWEVVMEDTTHFGFNKLDNKSLQVFTKGVNDIETITKNGTIRLKLKDVSLVNVFVDIALIQMPSSEEYPMLTVNGQMGQMDIEVSGNSNQLRYRVSTGASSASWMTNDENSLHFTAHSSKGAHNEYLTINFEINLTGAERKGYIIIKRVPKNGVADVRLNFTQSQEANEGLIIFSSLEGTELEGFRRRRINVRGYHEAPLVWTSLNEGHGPGEIIQGGEGGGGGFVRFNIGGMKLEYVTYNIILSNPDDYTWEATSTFNLTDLGIAHSSINLSKLLPPLMLDIVTGESGESVLLFVHTTGPGDPDIEGTLIIKAIPNNVLHDAFEERFALTITTNCDIGETQIGDLIWDDRNLGGDVPYKEVDDVATVAEYYTNKFPDVNLRYKGDYYNWEEAQTACPEGWYLPSKDQLGSLFQDIRSEMSGNDHFRFSKFRPFVYSSFQDKKDDAGFWIEDYTKDDTNIGAWLPISGSTVAFDEVNAIYWSSTEMTNDTRAYSLNTSLTFGRSHSNSKKHGFTVRCVKDVDTAP